MVFVPKSVLLAALAISPAIAAPVAQQFEATEEFIREPEFDEADFEARAPAGKFAALRRIPIGKVLDHASTAATIATLIPWRGNEKQARDLDFEETELETRAPAGKFAALRRIPIGKVLDHASTAATVATLIPWRSNKNKEQPRDFKDTDELVERDPGARWDLGKKSIFALGTGITMGTALGPLFKKPAPPAAAPAPPRREFVEDDEFEAREIDDLELEERAIQGQTLIKVGSSLGRASRWIVPATGLAGFGLGVGATLRQRSFDDDLEYEAREFDENELLERSFDELD